MHGSHLKPDLVKCLYLMLAQPAARVAHRIRVSTSHDSSSRNLFTAELEAAWKKDALQRHAASALAVGAALLTSLWLRPVFHRNSFLFYYAAVTFSAWYGGLYSGLLATGAAAAVASWLLFFKFPTPTPLPDDFAQIGLFIAVGAVTSLLSESLREAERSSQSLFRAQEFLGEASRVLSSSFDYETRLGAVAQTCVPALADYCVIDLAQKDGTLRRVAHADSANPQFPPETRLAPFLGPDGLPGAAEVIQNCQSRFFPEITESLLREWAGNPERLRALRDLHLRSAMIVPMVSGQCALGTITLVCCDSGRRYTSADLALVERLAQRAATALENAALYREAQVELRERERVERELRTQQERLQESEARFRTLAEAMPQMVWSTRPDGFVDYLSESWRTYTGQNPDQSLGRDGWKQVLHPEDRESVLERWARSLRTGEIYEVECRLRGADGSCRWILARGVPLRDDSGRITKWIGTCTDVHDRKLSEEALRTAEKLAATGRLISTMAHEINNPLEALTNLLHLLRSEPAVADTTAFRYLEIAERELARVNHVVNQTLGLFQGSTLPALVSLPKVADEVLQLYSGKISAKQIRVLRQYAEVEPVCAVHGEVRQVLATLIANAIDASQHGGILRLRISKGHGWRERQSRGVRVLVGDSGSGIGQENRARVFTPFFSTKDGIGTGLALWGEQGNSSQTWWNHSVPKQYKGPGQRHSVLRILPSGSS
jgi:PAS domain S-box-containing protein